MLQTLKKNFIICREYRTEAELIIRDAEKISIN